MAVRVSVVLPCVSVLLNEDRSRIRRANSWRKVSTTELIGDERRTRRSEAGAESPLGIHRFAIICVAATFTLIFVGGLVTSTGSALAVPDWPLAYGHLIPKLEGGVRFEYTPVLSWTEAPEHPHLASRQNFDQLERDGSSGRRPSFLPNSARAT